MPKISIIIPAYNADQYIERAISSVLRQTFRDTEIIVIDDGSSDKTPEILDKLSLLDCRLKIVHQSNGGVGKARNEGLRLATGEWIYFLDADDWIEKFYIQNFVNAIDDSDLIVQGFTKVFLDSTERVVEFNEIRNATAEQVVELLQFKKNAHNGYLWHRLLKKSIIDANHLQFKEKSNFAEDGEFFLCYMNHVVKASIVRGHGHHYVVQKNSLTTKKYGVDFYLEMIELYRTALSGISSSAHFERFSQYYVWSLVFYWIIAPAMEQNDISNLNKGFDYLSSLKISEFCCPTKLLVFLCGTNVGCKASLYVIKKFLNCYKKIMGWKYA